MGNSSMIIIYLRYEKLNQIYSRFFNLDITCITKKRMRNEEIENKQNIEADHQTQ